EGGRGHEAIVIGTFLLPTPDGDSLTEADLQEIFSPAGLSELLPPGASLIHAQTTKIDGDPAGILEYTMPFENAGMSAWMHAWSICFVLDRALIQIQFGIVGPAG